MKMQLHVQQTHSVNDTVQSLLNQFLFEQTYWREVLQMLVGSGIQSGDASHFSDINSLTVAMLQWN